MFKYFVGEMKNVRPQWGKGSCGSSWLSPAVGSPQVPARLRLPTRGRREELWREGWAPFVVSSGFRYAVTAGCGLRRRGRRSLVPSSSGPTRAHGEPDALAAALSTSSLHSSHFPGSVARWMGRRAWLQAQMFMWSLWSLWEELYRTIKHGELMKVWGFSNKAFWAQLHTHSYTHTHTHTVMWKRHLWVQA